MSKKTISYRDAGYFPKLICDYIEQNDALKPFYGRFPSVENLMFQANEKSFSFSEENRNILVERLLLQNKNITLSEATKLNIKSLRNKQTFTVTTGHQLNLFTGPLYFLYKIISVINLTKQLKSENPNYHFVPVFWMATEDHDFEEINYFNLYDEKIKWERGASGAVGELSTEGLDKVFEKFSSLIGNSDTAILLKNHFSEAYLKHNTLTEATRYLANELFKNKGLVIIDGNDSELKKLFIPFVEKELKQNNTFSAIAKTTQKLIQAGYHEQVHPRAVNLFYLQKGIRERIVKEKESFKILNTTIVFSEKEILAELQKHPERFSPNALLRPLYQEVVLPNLAYVGGGGELAYWFQLKDCFWEVGIPFPVLILRNSVLLIPEKLSKKLERLKVPVEKLFLSFEELSAWFIKKISDIPIDFSTQKQHLKRQFKELYDLAEKTDKSFIGAIAAQEKKQLNGLNKLEKRLLKAQKRKLKDQLNRLLTIHRQLFPNGSLQERNKNFSEFYLETGDDLVSNLITTIDPLLMEFMILECTSFTHS